MSERKQLYNYNILYICSIILESRLLIGLQCIRRIKKRLSVNKQKKKSPFTPRLVFFFFFENQDSKILLT